MDDWWSINRKSWWLSGGDLLQEKLMADLYFWWFLTGKADYWVVFLVTFNRKSWWLSSITGDFWQEKLMTEWYSWWFLTGKADDWVVFLVIFNRKSWWLSGIPGDFNRKSWWLSGISCVAAPAVPHPMSFNPTSLHPRSLAYSAPDLPHC